jgi:hypothetical protein
VARMSVNFLGKRILSRIVLIEDEKMRQLVGFAVDVEQSKLAPKCSQ